MCNIVFLGGSTILTHFIFLQFRWKHELEQFANVRVLLFGSKGGITSPDLEDDMQSLENNDIVLCEYGNLHGIEKILSSRQIKLFSIVVDFRHSLGLHDIYVDASRSHSVFPSHFVSSKWWDHFMAILVNENTRCLFMEYDHDDPLALSKTRLEERDQLVVLAKRAACILGLDIFRSNSNSIHRQVLSWARQAWKSKATNKAERVRKAIREAVIPMSFHSDEVIAPTSDLEWELRKCPMTASQRKDYEKCCFEVRGALSSSLSRIVDSTSSKFSESLLAVTSSLFRLRQYCFHPNSIELLTSLSHPGTGEVKFLLQREGSPSQPNAEMVEKLLLGSSKLKELLSIIVNEAGHSLDAENSIQQVVAEAIGGGKDFEGESPKKVAILAALPEIQLLVALFLNAIGIRNVMLSRRTRPKSSTDCSPGAKMLQEVIWYHNQSALASLCDENEGGERKAKAFTDTNVVVASPSIFGDDVGLGVEGAEMIVVLDTDWSGRDARVLGALVKRWLARNTLADRDIELLRLICENSMEETLFNDGLHIDEGAVWPVSADECFAFPESDDEAFDMYKEAVKKDKTAPSFPAVRLLRERGKLLSEVLGTSTTIPPILGSGENVRFLPLGSEDDIAYATDLRFLRQLLNQEAMSSSRNLFCGDSTILSTRALSATGNVFWSSLDSNLTASVLTRHDLAAISNFIFLEHLAKTQSTIKIPGGAGTPILLSQLTESSMMEADATDGSPKSSVEGNPSTLLLYQPKSSICGEVGTDYRNQKRRFNCYAKLFSCSYGGINLNDGSQGDEALVFFPPLFPLLQDSAKRARHDYYSTPSSFGSGESQENLPVREMNDTNGQLLTKRKSQEVVLGGSDESHVEKRLKTDAQPTPQLGAQGPNESSKVTPPQSNRKAPEDAFVGNLSIPERRNTFVPFPPVEDDFGLLGNGAIARPVDSASYSSYDSVRNGGYNPSTDKFDFLSYPIPCDAEESQELVPSSVENGNGDVILFIKKKPRLHPEYTSPFHGRQMQLPLRNHDLSSGVAQLSSGMSINGEDPSIRFKKRSPAQMSQTAFTRVTAGSSGLPGRSLPPPSRKDFRHIALATYQERQRTTGLSMFDSISYRMSAMRVERRVTEGMEQWLWKSTLSSHDCGPGIPTRLRYESSSNLTGQRSWVNVAEKLPPGTSTGDAARALSNIQRGAFQRSLVSPCRVDFGPFESGFLAAPSGMTGISTHRARVGVSLPMGVKIIQLQQGEKQSPPLPPDDEKLLVDSVMKYGENWLLVACAMSGFEHTVFKYSADCAVTARATAKSSRDCRDRWEMLIHGKPNLARELKNAEREVFYLPITKMHEAEGKELRKAEGVVVKSAHDISLLTTATLLKKDCTKIVEKTDVESSKKDEKKIEEDSPVVNSDKPTNLGDEVTGGVTAAPAIEPPNSRKRFLAAVSLAKTRKHVVPVTIPGVVSGQPPNQPVPSHPSHMQAVQTSITAQWAQGRTEMWPLQILDLADKQRSAVRATAMQRVPNGSSPSAHRPHPGSSVPPSHRAPSSRAPPRHPHHAHGPFPTVPANPPRPAAQPRGLPPPGNSAAGSSSQMAHPHHHSVSQPHQPHRTPAVASNTAHAYVPPQSASTVARPPPANTGSSHNTSSPEIPKPAPAAAVPPPQHPTAAAPPPPKPAVAPNPEAAAKSG